MIRVHVMWSDEDERGQSLAALRAAGSDFEAARQAVVLRATIAVGAGVAEWSAAKAAGVQPATLRRWLAEEGSRR